MEHLFKLLNEEEKRKQQTKEVALFNTPKPTTTTSKPVAVTTPTKDILPSEAALAVKPVEKSGFFERINWKQVAIWGTIVAAVVTIIAVPCALLIGGGGPKKISSNDFWNYAVTPLPGTDSDGNPRTKAVSGTPENKDYIKSNLSENVFYLGFYGNPNADERKAWIKHIEKVDAYLSTFEEGKGSAEFIAWWNLKPWDDTSIPSLPANYGISKTFWSNSASSGPVVFSIASGTIPINLDDLTSLMIRPVADSTIDTLNSILDSYSVIFISLYDDVLNADGSGRGIVFYNIGTTLSTVDVSNLV